MATAHYSHTQTSPFRYVVLALLVLTSLAAWSWRAEFWAWFSMVCIAGVFVLILLTLTTLSTHADDDSLWVQFGPLPLFSIRIPYQDILAVKVGRSRLNDGWGIHFLPGRGWTWSLWGFDCVDITRQRGTLRIGSDDAENLAAYLQSHIHAS